MTKFTPQERDNFSSREIALWAAIVSIRLTKDGMKHSMYAADSAIHELRKTEQSDGYVTGIYR
jgi:DUF1680 family protein